MYKTLAATNQVRFCRAGQSQGVCNCPDLRAVKLPEMVMQVLFLRLARKRKLELGLDWSRSRRAELTGERAKRAKSRRIKYSLEKERKLL